MSSGNPTAAEESLISRIFALADPQDLGIITGDAAVNVLSGANLANTVLGEIWAIADKDNNGFLTRKGVAAAIRLIGHAQNGEVLSEALLEKRGPLAFIEGISPKPTAKPSSPAPSVPAVRSVPQFPPLSQQDKTKFLKLFIGCGPVNGLLSGDKARDVFVKSKLPYDKLSQIWNLADTKTRGSLDSTDFTLGMYFIQVCMSNPAFSLPDTLPPWLYEQAIQSLDLPMIATHATGASSTILSSPRQNSFGLQPQMTGHSIFVTPDASTSHPSAQHTGSPGITSTTFMDNGLKQPSARQWVITREAKASADTIFESLDIYHYGFIEGDVAVPFMLKSNLPGSDLAQIWDLSDLNSDGHLTREGFAVAMHLIKLRLAGTELPQSLPQSLVQSVKPGAPIDLLGDIFSTPSVTAPVVSQPTGSNGVSYATPRPVVSPHPTGPISAPGANQIPVSSQYIADSTEDLLGDDDDAKVELPDSTAEIGNLRNQLSSTTRSLNVVKMEREDAEKLTATQASELSQLQSQLASAKASYEKESEYLAKLRDRFSIQRTEIQKAKEELITAESDLSASKVEKAEVERSVLKDKEEIRDLQKRMKDISAETDAIRTEIEKLKKEARQQKGLLAIAKKQLATAEGEKLKQTKELAVAQRELDLAQKEKELAETQLADLEASSSVKSLVSDPVSPSGITSPVPSTFAAAIPLPDTPQPSTPQPPSRQSTNPFARLISSPPPTGVNASAPISSEAAPSMPGNFAGILDDPSKAAAEVGLDQSVANLPGPTADASRFEELFTSVESTYPSLDENTSGPANEEARIDSGGADDLLNPVKEVDINDSDSSDGESYVLADHEASTPVDHVAQNGVENDTSTVPPSNGEDTTKTVSMASVAEPGDRPRSSLGSGHSSPKRSRSPYSARSMSPTSPVGSLDPFVGTGLTHTPLEPPTEDIVPPTIETVLEPAAALSTLSDFDEAFGSASVAKETAPLFKFDSAFDDNFDFSPSIANVNGTSAVASGTSEIAPTPFIPPTINPTDSFPSVNTSTVPALPFAPVTTAPNGTSQQATNNTSVSFDDAFGFNLSSTNGHSNDQPIPTSVQVQGASLASPHVESPNIPPALARSPSISSSPRTRTSSPPRSISPQIQTATVGSSGAPPRASSPPRTSSPRLRVLSGSKVSSSSPEAKTETHKHRRSIRFPFGRKDKSKDKEEKKGQALQASSSTPTQQSLLSPVTESPVPGTLTPAVEDDVEPVKQLAAMGFSRTQSIAALEAHGYDLQKALNSLLGTA